MATPLETGCDSVPDSEPEPDTVPSATVTLPEKPLASEPSELSTSMVTGGVMTAPESVSVGCWVNFRIWLVVVRTPPAMVPATAADGMPLAMATTLYEPSGMPAGKLNCVLTLALPVATLVPQPNVLA